MKLYFDKLSGLLVRQTRFLKTVVGVNPMHVEYADYRLVAGVKMPFRWTTTWTDGQSTTQLTAVQPNVTDRGREVRQTSASGGTQSLAQ